ncbi:MAG: hypothetical protein WC525_07550 [Candidatus Thermoplasmatota archaeon]
MRVHLFFLLDHRLVRINRTFDASRFRRFKISMMLADKPARNIRLNIRLDSLRYVHLILLVHVNVNTRPYSQASQKRFQTSSQSTKVEHASLILSSKIRKMRQPVRRYSPIHHMIDSFYFSERKRIQNIKIIIPATRNQYII